jgi:hypothetical protein
VTLLSVSPATIPVPTNAWTAVMRATTPERCHNKDWPLHKILCDAFSLLEPRPSYKHYRCILFPAKSIKPRFVWVELGSKASMDLKFEIYTGARYLSATKANRFHTLSHDLDYTVNVLYANYAMDDLCPNN